MCPQPSPLGRGDAQPQHVQSQQAGHAHAPQQDGGGDFGLHLEELGQRQGAVGGDGQVEQHHAQGEEHLDAEFHLAQPLAVPFGQLAGGDVLLRLDEAAGFPLPVPLFPPDGFFFVGGGNILLLQLFLRIQRLRLLVHLVGVVQGLLGHPPHHVPEGLELGDGHLDDIIPLPLLRRLLSLGDEGALPVPDGGLDRLLPPHLFPGFLLLRLLVGTGLAHLRRPRLLLAQGLFTVGVPQRGGHLLLDEPLGLLLLLLRFHIGLGHWDFLRFRFRRRFPFHSRFCGCFRRLFSLLGRRRVLLLQGFF